MDSFKKIEIFEIQFFSKTPSLPLFFFKFLTSFFLFHLSILAKKLWKILWCFIGWIRHFIKKFWKIL